MGLDKRRKNVRLERKMERPSVRQVRAGR